MKSIAPIGLSTLLAGSAWAHVAEVPPLQHVFEHAWLLLALAPLLLLLPGLARRGRR